MYFCNLNFLKTQKNFYKSHCTLGKRRTDKIQQPEWKFITPRLLQDFPCTHCFLICLAERHLLVYCNPAIKKNSAPPRDLSYFIKSSKNTWILAYPSDNSSQFLLALGKSYMKHYFWALCIYILRFPDFSLTLKLVSHTFKWSVPSPSEMPNSVEEKKHRARGCP